MEQRHTTMCCNIFLKSCKEVVVGPIKGIDFYIPKRFRKSVIFHSCSPWSVKKKKKRTNWPVSRIED